MKLAAQVGSSASISSKLSPDYLCLLRPGIHLYDERLAVTLASGSQLYRVRSRQHDGNTATSEATTTATSSCGSLRRRRPQIPNPSMHSRRGRKRLRDAHPKRGNVELVGIDWRCLVFARVTANHVARRIENLKRHRP